MHKAAITLIVFVRPSSLQTPVIPGFPLFSNSPLSAGFLPTLSCLGRAFPVPTPTHSPCFLLTTLALRALHPRQTTPSQHVLHDLGGGICAPPHSLSTHRRVHHFLCYLLGGSYHAQKTLCSTLVHSRVYVSPPPFNPPASLLGLWTQYFQSLCTHLFFFSLLLLFVWEIIIFMSRYLKLYKAE